MKFCKVNHFADNTNLLCLSNSIKKLNKLVNTDLKHLVNWSNANKISHMSGCKCSKGQNGFWALGCVEGARSKCNNKTVPQIPNLNDELLSYNQFVFQSTHIFLRRQK